MFAGNETRFSHSLQTGWYRRIDLKDLRATFGTRLAEAGCDAFTIAQLLGHSDVRVTMRYVRAVEDTKRIAVEAIKLSAGNMSKYWPVGKNSRQCCK